MKSRKNVIFLGMMGSGKSSIGLIVSKKLKMDLVDIDKEIEKKIGMKIWEIFKKKGEQYFRENEEKITLDFLEKKNKIVALGGGAFLNKNIRTEVLQNHISFWLDWDPVTLIDRIKYSKNSKKRPIATRSSKKELLEIIKKRSKIYSKALYKINCENLKKNEIADKILTIYEKHKTDS